MLLVIADRKRHHSGDSLASQSSTSTQLSISQHSVSSNRPDSATDQPTNHKSASEPVTSKPANHRPDTLPHQTNQPPVTVINKDIIIPSGPLPSKPTTIASAVENVHNIPTVFDANRLVHQPISINTHSTNPATPGRPSVTSPAGSMTSPGAARSGRKSSTGSRKRPKSASSTDSRRSPITPDVGQFKCMWEGCATAGYTTSGLLRRHVSTSHTNTAGKCVWSGCDRVERKRWALVSHVNVSTVCDIVPRTPEQNQAFFQPQIIIFATIFECETGLLVFDVWSRSMPGAMF